MTPTETVQLWLDNSGDSYNEVCGEAREAIAAHTGPDSGLDESGATYALAAWLKDDYAERESEAFMANQASWQADLFNHALSEVDWHDIAESYVNHVRSGQ